MIEKREILNFLQKKRTHYLKNTKTICKFILQSLPVIEDLNQEEKRMVMRNINILLGDSFMDEGIITNLMGKIQNEPNKIKK